MSKPRTTIWDRLQHIDRRVLYTLIFVSVIVPVFLPLSLPTAVSPESQAFFDAVDALPAGGNVMFAFDFWPSTTAETEPLAVATLRHCFQKDLHVIGLSNVGMGGPSIADRILHDIGDEYGKRYGEDYINLGYKAGYQAVLLGMATGIGNIFPTDHNGTRLDALPLARRVTSYDSIQFVVVITDNIMVDYWVSLVNAQSGVPMAAGVTAVVAPKALSYVQSGQYKGLLGGMKGAAEYEHLLNSPDKASRGMDSQSLIHLLIIAFVAMGNLGYVVTRRRDAGPPRDRG